MIGAFRERFISGMLSRDYEAELLHLCLQCDPPNCKALVRSGKSGYPPPLPPEAAAKKPRERMERLAKGMLIATGCRFRCSEMTGPSRRGRLVGVMCRTCLLLRADFLHFVSFRISAADNRLQPFGKFFPTGHLKRNGPSARNEMALPKRAGNPPEGSRRNLRDTGAEKIVGRSGMPSGKKTFARRDVLRSCPQSGDRAAAALKPCPGNPAPGNPVSCTRNSRTRSAHQARCLSMKLSAGFMRRL